MNEEKGKREEQLKMNQKMCNVDEKVQEIADSHGNHAESRSGGIDLLDMGRSRIWVGPVYRNLIYMFSKIVRSFRWV